MVASVRIAALALAASFGLAASGQAAATGFDLGTVADALHWRSIGPFRGGRVLTVEGAADDPLHAYFGAVNGGVWETRDAGRTWKAIFDDAPVGSIGAIALAPGQPGTLYVGTGEADMRSDIAQGVGVFKTTDDGRTWAPSGLADTQAISRILVSPNDSAVVLVAALGHPYGPNAQRGVFRSSDGGATWERTLFKDADTGAIDLAFKPGDPNTVYAALWRTRRPPWNVYPPSSGPGSGLYKSIDGGRTWAQLTGRGLPAAPGRIGLATAARAPERLYALIDATVGGGLYRSDDAGASWTLTSTDARIHQRGWYFGELTVNPANPDQIWVCNTIMLRSDDGGRTFVAEKGDPTGDDFHTLWIDPKNPARRLLGVDQGALMTLNGGASWSSWFNQPTGQFYHVVTDNRFPYRVYGAQQDSGAAGVPSRTGGVDGIDMTQFREMAAGGESDNIAPDPDDPDTIYGGRVDKLDLRSGQTRSVDPTLAFPDVYRATWTLPLVFGRRDHALYFANQRIFRTRDGGRRWTPISPDLTRPAPGAPPNLDASTIADDEHPGPRKGVVYTVAPSPRRAALIWAGTDDGLVWRTRDGGAHWLDVTPAAVGPWSKIGAVEPSHFDDATAYVAVDRHRLDDFAPHLWRTHDGGRNWTPIVDGLAGGGGLDAVNVVREDPRQPGLLYAGTERGAFLSGDDGEHWRPLQTGLPPTSVRDIEVHGDDLVIATHGRGFYILDDIASLREAARDARDGVRLFAPAVAVRARPFGFTGTPAPAEEPKAANPPSGAYLDYYLPTAASTAVMIRITDTAGRLVRQFSSADASTPLDPTKIAAAPEWLTPPVPPSPAPGLHRIVWDLHYAPQTVLAEGELPVAGVWAPPGHYRVTLEVDGARSEQPLDLRPDPRVKATPAAYQREFALARRVEAARLRLHMALAAKRRDPASNEALTRLAAEFDKLATAADGADGGPSPDAAAGYLKASAALESALKR